MDHIAIMKKSWGLIPKILSGEKTIESRWYQTKRSPWGKIKKGDNVYFKNGGELIILEARVSEVMQFEINTLNDVQEIVDKYGKEICLLNKDVKTWMRLPKYCILIWLENPELLGKSFDINKTGFGIGCAWISVDDVKNIAKI